MKKKKKRENPAAKEMGRERMKKRRKGRTGFVEAKKNNNIER